MVHYSQTMKWDKVEGVCSTRGTGGGGGATMVSMQPKKIAHITLIIERPRDCSSQVLVVACATGFTLDLYHDWLHI